MRELFRSYVALTIEGRYSLGEYMNTIVPHAAHCPSCASYMGGQSARRGCFFCGSTPLTKEHVLPDWLNKAVPEWNRSGIQKHVPADGGHEFQSKVFGRSMLRNTVKVACAECNNGWMSSLESRMMPHILRLLLGEPMILAASDFDDFIRWSIKTHMMRTQWDHPGAAFPDSHRAAIRGGGEIPQGWSVWLGRTLQDGVSHRNWSGVVHINDDYPAFLISHTTLTMGSFVLSVAYVADPVAQFHFLEFMDGVSPPDTRLIRPLEQPPILCWPPAANISAEECDELSDAARQWANISFGFDQPRLKHLDLSLGIEKGYLGIPRTSPFRSSS